MLRNDLITRLSDHDNDTVGVRVGDILVDTESVNDDGGGIVTNADITPPEVGFPLPGYEVTRQLALYPFADVTVEIGGTLIDVCAVTYDSHHPPVINNSVGQASESGCCRRRQQSCSVEFGQSSLARPRHPWR